MITKLTAIFVPTNTEQMHDYQFRYIEQFDKEPFDEFVKRVTQKAKLCGFGAQLDKNIMGQIIRGCSSKGLKRRALAKTGTIELPEVIKMGQTEENVKIQMQGMKNRNEDSSSSEDEERREKPQSSEAHNVNSIRTSQNRQRPQSHNFTRSDQKQMMKEKQCFRCGGDFPHKKECPAVAAECFKCGKIGHFKQYCLSHERIPSHQRDYQKPPREQHHRRPRSNENYRAGMSRATPNQHQQPHGSGANASTSNAQIDALIRAIQSMPRDAHQDEFDSSVNSDDLNSQWIRAINERSADKKVGENKISSPKIILNICQTPVPFIIDTGSTLYNLMDQRTYNSLTNKPDLETTKVRLFPYGIKEPIKILGQITTRVKNVEGVYKRIEFKVTEGTNGNLLGCESAVNLGYVQFVRSVEQDNKRDPLLDKLTALYPKLFSGKIGTLNTHEVKLHIDKSVRPVKHKLRPIPVYMQEAVAKELKNLREQGIIEPVNGPTEWLSSIVPVVKKAQTKENPLEVRICTDGREANKAIMRERYQFPTLDELILQLHGAKFFIKI